MRLILSFLLILIAVPVWAGPLEDAAAAYNRQDYATTLRLLRPLAAQGEAVAQSTLGFMYVKGQGVVQDYVEAVKWYRLAVTQGNAWAQYSLGLMYQLGQGVVQDYVRAHMWFNLAAASGKSESGSEGRDHIAKRMTSEQIAEAQKLAKECQVKNFKGCD